MHSLANIGNLFGIDGLICGACVFISLFIVAAGVGAAYWFGNRKAREIEDRLKNLESKVNPPSDPKQDA